METIEFEPFPKIPRLRRDMVITEKIDGSNAAVGIRPAGASPFEGGADPAIIGFGELDGVEYVVYAQSRKRLITPTIGDDNHEFARWVCDNAQTLVADLGPGLHFGEWWGYGIQRGYGLARKHFALFNTNRWEEAPFDTPCMSTVPVLWRGNFDQADIDFTLAELMNKGSQAAPGFMRPEGIVIFHRASGHLFKVLAENDHLPKGVMANRVDDILAYAQ